MHLPTKYLLQGGKYKIVRFLSSGGFGNTYEGVHTMMDTRVAIKEFFPRMFCNRDENTSHVTVATQGNRELVEKLRKKFNEEAKAVFQMNHPNIVRVLDIFEENGTAYYVMDYIDGKSLNEITKERGALPESEAVGYIRQVADALKYVHSLNRLHLDIKPGNIMVDKNSKAILIDFGASKHYDDESGENTSTLMGVNTKGYAPIEQSTQSFTSFSPATDIYALGATLYKLLTGIVPPDANLLLAEEEALQPLPNSISAPTRKAVLVAMSLRRKNRPQSVVEFLLLLDKDGKPKLGKETIPCLTKGNDEETLFIDEDTPHTTKQEKPNDKMSFNEVDAKDKKDLKRIRAIIDEKRVGKYSEAYYMAKDLAHKAYSEAWCLLGRCYLMGIGVEADEKEAVVCFRNAAEQNNAEAQFWLGSCYVGGIGVSVNHDEAYKWFKKSAEQGDAQGECAFGECYFNGFGVDENKKLAITWFKKSAALGDSGAQYNLGNCYENGLGVEKDEKLAVKWYTKASKQYDPNALLALGVCYHNGVGVDVSLKEAKRYYDMVLKNSDAEDDVKELAKSNLALLQESHVGCVGHIWRIFVTCCLMMVFVGIIALIIPIPMVAGLGGTFLGIWVANMIFSKN